MPTIHTDLISSQRAFEAGRREMEQLLRTAEAAWRAQYECIPNPVPPPEPISQSEESAFQELDRVTSARAHRRSGWTTEIISENPCNLIQTRGRWNPDQSEPTEHKKKLSAFSILVAKEKEINSKP